MHHMRLGDFELQSDPVTADQFTSQVGSIQFFKNDEKKIIGFRLSGGRIKNLRFDKKLELIDAPKTCSVINSI